MDAIELLTHRQSCLRLQAPAPDGQVLDDILEAGLRTPDHGGLHPWRFMVLTGAALSRLGDYFADAAQQQGQSEEQIAKALAMPTRAPMIIIGIASPISHEKVPEWEQWMSAGCALMAMQQAAQAHQYGGIWRSGWVAEDANVATALGLKANEKIMGYLYLGTPTFTPKFKATPNVAEHVAFFAE